MGHMIDIADISAYRAEPVGELKGALIVIHEIWGLVDHIKDLADRFAAQGYLVIAPDVLSGVGVRPEVGEALFARMFSPDEATRLAVQPDLREALAPIRTPEFATGTVAALSAVVDYLEAQPGVEGRVAVTGYCFGGTYSFALASADHRISAAMPWYGTAPGAEAMAGIECPIFALYGAIDPALIDVLPTVTADMAAAGVDFTTKVYEGAKHAFFNNTGANYDADAAADAWPLALDFLERTLNR